jgi:hypothetical protein
MSNYICQLLDAKKMQVLEASRLAALHEKEQMEQCLNRELSAWQV